MAITVASPHFWGMPGGLVIGTNEINGLAR